jgi:cytochrome c-type biogenesis protein CcmH
MEIWVVFAAMTAAAAFVVLAPLARRSRGDAAETGTKTGAKTGAGAAGHDISVYKDQLAEVDRDLERGVIAAPEAEAARTEIARRLLKAAREAEEAPPAVDRGATLRRRAAAVMAVVVLPVVALGLYGRLGQPDMPDAPLAPRQEAKLETQSIDQLVAKVEAHLAKNPEDGQGWDLIAPVYMRMGRASDAAQAFRNAIRIAGSTPKREVQLGEALMNLAGGVVTAEARASFEKAKADAGDAGVLARMYLALALSQDGKLAESAAAWKALLATSKGGERWRPIAEKELAAVEAKLGGAPAPANAPDAAAGPAQGAAAPPTATPGPSAGDVASAAAMAPADRQKMIEGMVQRLAEHLDASGGSVEEWTRLIRALSVLGRTEEAKAAADKARAAMKDDEAGRGRIDALAKELGIAS